MSQQAPHGGAAEEYFQDGNRGAPNGQQQQYQQQPYQQQNYQQQPYQQQDYQQNASNDQAPPYSAPSNPNEKQDFHEAFKVPKPKWNDLWAAILFLATFAGFIAVSGIAIRGYQVTSDGSTNNNTFGLNKLTIVLL
jgi:hypothetical protein